MQAKSTINTNPRPSFLNAPCPECSRTTDEGMCYNITCHIGFYNVQVELGREIPEDWLMVDVEREPVTPAPFPKRRASQDRIAFPEAA